MGSCVKWSLPEHNFMVIFKQQQGPGINGKQAPIPPQADQWQDYHELPTPHNVPNIRIKSRFQSLMPTKPKYIRSSVDKGALLADSVVFLRIVLMKACLIILINIFMMSHSSITILTCAGVEQQVHPATRHTTSSPAHELGCSFFHLPESILDCHPPCLHVPYTSRIDCQFIHVPRGCRVTHQRRHSYKTSYMKAE